MRWLRLLAAVVSLSLRRELAFRANLICQVLLAAVVVASGLAALALVYTRTETLGGWSLGEAIVLFGTFQLMAGLLATFIEPNLMWFANQVRSGKLDDALLKPVPSIVLVSLGSCAPLRLAEAVMGAAVVGVGLSELGRVPTPSAIVGWLLMLGAGIAITWATRVLVASLALWAPALELDVVYGAVWQFGRYPVSIYPRPIRFALTYMVPVAFIATVPARALIRGPSVELVLAALAVAAAAIAIVRAVWDAGLKRYTSATS